MREIRQSGSEGGVALTPSSLPLFRGRRSQAHAPGDERAPDTIP